MNKKKHNVLKIALVFTGNVIGAGFATGSELSRFFVRYGKASVLGLVLCTFFFALICRMVLLKVAVTGAKDFTEYFSGMNGILVKFMKFTVTAYLWAALCVMYSAGGAVFFRNGLPRRLGVWSVAVVCVSVLWFGADGFVKLNQVLTPIMIFGIIFSSATAFIPVFSYGILYMPLIYASYNTITVVSVLTAVSAFVDSRKTAVKASYLAGAFLTLTALSLWLLLFFYADLNAELPVLSVLSGFYSTVYTAVLYIAVLTTAVGSGIGIIKNIGIKTRIGILILFLPVLVSQTAGLDVLVSRLYSFFGGIGTVVLAITVLDGIKYLRKME